MEYMLLKDGSFKTFEPIEQTERVRELLKFHDGIAYYWNYRGVWKAMAITTPMTEFSSNEYAQNVPDVIKLAAMLE